MYDDDDDACCLGTGEAIVARPKALLVRLDKPVRSSKKELWIPQSQIHDDSEVFAQGHTGKVIVKNWWAEKESLV